MVLVDVFLNARVGKRVHGRAPLRTLPGCMRVPSGKTGGVRTADSGGQLSASRGWEVWT